MDIVCVPMRYVIRVRFCAEEHAVSVVVFKIYIPFAVDLYLYKTFLCRKDF